MATKGKGGMTVAAVREIAEPIASQLGLKIWDIVFAKEGVDWILRIFIDKDGGVGINDCESFSRAIDTPLDEKDPIEQSYCLEVSSPGIERDLTKPEHFVKCTGRKIKLRTVRPVDGNRDFSGILESSDGNTITLRSEDGSGLTISKKETSFIKLDDFDI